MFDVNGAPEDVMASADAYIKDNGLEGDSYNSLNSSSARLEDRIMLQHLHQLMQEFAKHRPPDPPRSDEHSSVTPRLQRRTPGCMNLQEFKDTLFKVLGTKDYSEYLEKLFIKLDTSCDGYVDWNEFSTHLLFLYRENDFLRTKNEVPFLAEPKIRNIVHNKQEQTSKIVAVSGPVRYLTISKEGAISVWRPNLTVEKLYTVTDHVDEQKRRFKMWVTDAVYMKNCEKLAIGSTSRDIRFYDVSSSQYFEEYHLFAMTDVPYSFDYYYNKQQPNSESVLVFGVDTGDLHLLTFLKPVTQLFHSPFKNNAEPQKIFMQDLSSHKMWVRHQVLTNVHPEMVRQVRYLPENESIISASLSSKNSVVICDIIGVKKTYVFRIDKGVECFDHNKNLNLLVTGSGDHIVRLWNPYVTSSPIAVLSGHATGVIGVVIHEKFGYVFSYTKDTVIKVWDVKDHTCIQTVNLKFPSSLHGRMPEHGEFPIHLQGPPHNALVVTCNDYIGTLSLGRQDEQTSSMAVTHDTQLCSAIYNNLFKQVVTGCDSSTIAVWDVETGNRSTILSRAHGNEEITCLNFDTSCRRLISGARNGTIKIWNFQNGQNLHSLEPIGEAEVTGIVQLPDKKVVLTVGWNQMIVCYDDPVPDSMNIRANTSWKGGQLHKDDILTLDYAPPNFLATGGYDGEITVWEVDTEKIYVRLRKGQPPNITKRLEALKTAPVRPISRSGSNLRPNSRHKSSHKIEPGQTPPVDKLMFLKVRAGVRFTESAILVSSEAGSLRWWNIYTNNRELGHFYAAKDQDESILAMCTTPDDSVLFTGDTQGFIRAWDIVDYCTKFDGHVTLTAPPSVTEWRAHDSAVVSIENIKHDAGAFILTASTDKTARLWTHQGYFIGTFGQRTPWNLKTPSTWAHPRTPWSAQEEQQTLTENVKQEEIQDEDSNEDKAELVLDRPSSNTELKDMIPSATQGLDMREKSFISPIQTFLGTKVKQDLVRRQRDRKGRRSNFGDIAQPSTARFGSQCSPYHALSPPEWHDVDLPTNLPLSHRMQGLSYSGDNLTADYINSMDFTYSVPDSVPATRGHTPATSRSFNPGQTESLVQKQAKVKLPPAGRGRRTQHKTKIR